ncbi:MAG: acetyl-CoA carboxylase, carboxyltransferase subunit beta [Chloroflexota bacterium]
MPIKLPSFRPRKDAHPADLWTKCPSCSEMLFNKQLEKSDRVCSTCGHHFRLSAEARIALLVDDRSFIEHDAGLQSVDALGFVDQKAYPDRLAAAQLATGMRDAAVRGIATIDGHQVSLCVMDFAFMGGSMGAVVGEKVTRAAEHALRDRLPLIIVSASGGARMQEGTLALMQLAKTCGALERLRAADVPYISIMSDPTTGGVFASYAVLGDINMAEPNALIGFAGARVSAGTIAQELPVGFQRSEFLFDHGFVDRVVPRSELKAEVAQLLHYLVPAIHDEPSHTTRPSFDPIGFLASLAEKVVPDFGSGDAGVVSSASDGYGPASDAAGPAAGSEADGPSRESDRG